MAGHVLIVLAHTSLLHRSWHPTAEVALQMLASFVTRRWTMVFGSEPPPLEVNQRIDRYFEQTGDFYAIAEARVETDIDPDAIQD